MATASSEVENTDIPVDQHYESPFVPLTLSKGTEEALRILGLHDQTELSAATTRQTSLRQRSPKFTVSSGSRRKNGGKLALKHSPQQGRTLQDWLEGVAKSPIRSPRSINQYSSPPHSHNSSRSSKARSRNYRFFSTKECLRNQSIDRSCAFQPSDMPEYEAFSDSRDSIRNCATVSPTEGSVATSTAISSKDSSTQSLDSQYQGHGEDVISKNVKQIAIDSTYGWDMFPKTGKQYGNWGRYLAEVKQESKENQDTEPRNISYNEEPNVYYETMTREDKSRIEAESQNGSRKVEEVNKKDNVVAELLEKTENYSTNVPASNGRSGIIESYGSAVESHSATSEAQVNHGAEYPSSPLGTEWEVTEILSEDFRVSYDYAAGNNDTHVTSESEKDNSSNEDARRDGEESDNQSVDHQTTLSQFTMLPTTPGLEGIQEEESETEGDSEKDSETSDMSNNEPSTGSGAENTGQPVLNNQGDIFSDPVRNYSVGRFARLSKVQLRRVVPTKTSVESRNNGLLQADTDSAEVSTNSPEENFRIQQQNRVNKLARLYSIASKSGGSLQQAFSVAGETVIAEKRAMRLRKQKAGGE